MNALFRIKDSTANQVSYYHLVLLMASLPFDMFYSHLILISLIIHTLIHLKREHFKQVFTIRTIILQSVFFITVLSTVYSINMAKAFDEWGKDITILLIPLLFCLNQIDLEKYRDNLLFSFSIFCTATILYLYLDALITIRHYGLPLKVLFSGSFINHNFSEPIQMHATFFSMQVIIALAYVIYAFFKKGVNGYNRFFLVAFGFILTCGLIQLCSKSIFVILLLIINIAVPYFLLQGATRWKYITVAAICSMIFVVCILNTRTFKERFVTELKTDISKARSTEVEDGRLSRWKVAFGLIEKSPVIGYGAGSEIGLLQDGFFNHKLYDSYLFRLNSHSQYISFWLKSGIIGLLIYIATLVYGFKVALQRNDFVMFSFMLTIAIISFSENLLDVDKGIFFYVFFFPFLICSAVPQVNPPSGPVIRRKIKNMNLNWRLNRNNLKMINLSTIKI